MACQATRAEHVVAAYGVLVTSIQATFIQDMMAATGVPGTLIDLVFWLPVLWLGFRHVRVMLNGPALPWTALLAYMTVTTAWSEMQLDAAAKALSLATTLAWAALLIARPAVLFTVVRTATVVCLASFVAGLAGVTLMFSTNFFPVMVALFGRLALREKQTASVSMATGLLECLLYGLLVIMVALSTFRAATIATVIGLVWCGRSSRAALVAATVLGVAVGAYLAVAPPRQQTYNGQVERTDIRGRFETMDEDRLSGRQDIWENVLNDVGTAPPWLLYGTGLGDVDRYVGSLNPSIALTARDGQPQVCTHNLFLEVLLATGVPGVALLAWAVVDGLHRVRADTRLAMAVAMLIAANAGIPVYDRAGGGTLFVALMLALAAHGATRAVAARAAPPA